MKPNLLFTAILSLSHQLNPEGEGGGISVPDEADEQVSDKAGLALKICSSTFFSQKEETR